eukprot:COSAG01_NODE_1122_length_11627_cov_25.881725_14_plen_69_part_00
MTEICLCPRLFLSRNIECANFTRSRYEELEKQLTRAGVPVLCAVPVCSPDVRRGWGHFEHYRPGDTAP